MKTNVLFTLLLAAVAVFVMGCQKPQEYQPGPTTQQSEQRPVAWQSKIGGSYKSVIFNRDRQYEAKTTFKVDGDKLSGDYELDVHGLIVTGTLGEFSITGDRKLKCRWRDDVDRVGDLSVTFSQDLSSFEGQWEPDDGDGNGAWNGKKN